MYKLESNMPELICSSACCSLQVVYSLFFFFKGVQVQDQSRRYWTHYILFRYADFFLFTVLKLNLFIIKH